MPAPAAAGLGRLLLSGLSKGFKYGARASVAGSGQQKAFNIIGDTLPVLGDAYALLKGSVTALRGFVRGLQQVPPVTSEIASRIRAFSPEVIGAQLELDIGNLMRDLQRAQELGPDAAQNLRLQNELNQELLGFDIALSKVGMNLEQFELHLKLATVRTANWLLTSRREPESEGDYQSGPGAVWGNQAALLNNSNRTLQETVEQTKAAKEAAAAAKESNEKVDQLSLQEMIGLEGMMVTLRGGHYRSRRSEP